MERLKVAITQGDTNGIGYKLIFEAFGNPEVFELCTPVVYGNPKIAAYHRKFYNSETSFHIISEVSDTQQGHLNVLTVHDDELKVSIGASNEESRQAANLAEETAKSDFNQGRFDVLVNITNGEDYKSSSPKLYVTDEYRIMLVSEKTHLNEIPSDITAQKITERAKKLHKILRNDFRITNPRIAVLMQNASEEEEEKTIIRPTIEELVKEGIQCFGPYRATEYFANHMADDFDAVLAMYGEQVLPHYTRNDEECSVMIDEEGFISVMPLRLNDGCSLLKHIYLGIDAYRNRKNAEEASAHPLPKLFHERHEDEERRPARFQPFDFEKKTDEQ
ncbi:MAG: 4-hydroxythreonine-4-phosphate dehydrogenase PdxA [Prevotella sp.]|nr:4-hydroxythreonine-4-phosphate dehydrogenase PdxA [Prevotella sp.]